MKPVRRSEKPTLKTIAKLSGLAVPTVSRALSDAPDIGQATKEKVRAIAQKIGYVPNRAGVRLRTGRTNVISLVLSPQPDLTNHTGNFISSIASGLEGSQFHMNVTPFNYAEDIMKPIKYIVETGSADAVIINQVQPEDERVAYMMERGFPFVTHGRTIWAEGHSYYDFDNDLVARLAVRAFAGAGRKHVLLIAPPREQLYATHIVNGAVTEAEKLGLNVQVHPFAHTDMTRRTLSSFIADSLQELSTVDAIFCSSTNVAIAAVAALEGVGRKLTIDIDVFAKEAVPILDSFRPGIMTVEEDLSLAGAFLSKAAMAALRNPEAPPMQFIEKPVFELPKQ